MRRKRTSDSKRAKTEGEKALYVAGVPYRFWRDSEGHITFKPMVYNDDLQVSRKQQDEWFDRIVYSKEPWKRPWLVAVGSEPTDHEAMVMMCRLVKQLIFWGKEVTVQDMAADDVSDVYINPLAYFGYNIADEAMDWHRRSRIRDWIMRHSDSFRVLAIAGNPMTVCMDRLRVRPDAVLYIDGTKRITLSLG